MHETAETETAETIYFNAPIITTESGYFTGVVFFVYCDSDSWLVGWFYGV